MAKYTKEYNKTEGPRKYYILYRDTTQVASIRDEFIDEILTACNNYEPLKADFDKAVELLREMDETGIIDHQAIAQFLKDVCEHDFRPIDGGEVKCIKCNKIERGA